MRSNLPPDAFSDPFHPPSIPTEVQCLHCGEQYESYLIEWREKEQSDGGASGFWCCPTPGCDGAGFGFDIWPTDSEWVDPDGREMGWCWDDDEDDEWDEDEDGDEPMDPEIEAAVQHDIEIIEKSFAEDDAGDEPPWTEEDEWELERRRRGKWDDLPF